MATSQHRYSCRAATRTSSSATTSRLTPISMETRVGRGSPVMSRWYRVSYTRLCWMPRDTSRNPISSRCRPGSRCQRRCFCCGSTPLSKSTNTRLISAMNSAMIHRAWHPPHVLLTAPPSDRFVDIARIRTAIILSDDTVNYKQFTFMQWDQTGSGDHQHGPLDRWP